MLHDAGYPAEILSEGGVRQLYRGGLPEITGLIPRATAALSTLEFSRRMFRCAVGCVLYLPVHALMCVDRDLLTLFC